MVKWLVSGYYKTLKKAAFQREHNVYRNLISQICNRISLFKNRFLFSPFITVIKWYFIQNVHIWEVKFSFRESSFLLSNNLGTKENKLLVDCIHFGLQNQSIMLIFLNKWEKLWQKYVKWKKLLNPHWPFTTRIK